jgi:hypothetical protein
VNVVGLKPLTGQGIEDRFLVDGRDGATRRAGRHDLAVSGAAGGDDGRER